MYSDYLDEPINLYLDDYCHEYEDYKDNEKYYWKTQENKYIKVDDLEDNHIKNIVYLFGKQKLNNCGYHNIVERFNKIIKSKGE